MNVSEKAAYLKGLMEGMKIDETTNEGKLFKAIADLLEDLSLSVLDLEEGQSYLEEYIDEIDADLGEVERDVYECEDDDWCDCDDCCDCDDDCDCCDCDDDCCDCFATVCPGCGEEVYFDADTADDVIVCPSCNTEIELEDIEDIDE